MSTFKSACDNNEKEKKNTTKHHISLFRKAILKRNTLAKTSPKQPCLLDLASMTSLPAWRKPRKTKRIKIKIITIKT